jgi:hypothetical protein
MSGSEAPAYWPVGPGFHSTPDIVTVDARLSIEELIAAVPEGAEEPAAAIGCAALRHTDRPPPESVAGTRWLRGLQRRASRGHRRGVVRTCDPLWPRAARLPPELIGELNRQLDFEHPLFFDPYGAVLVMVRSGIRFSESL